MERGELVDRLGRHLREYPCDNGRRLRHGIWSLAVVVVLVPIGLVSWFLHDDFVSSVPNPPTYTPFTLVGSAAFGISVLLLPYGCRRLIQGLRSRGERIDLHENGFVHHLPRGDEAFAWHDITVVDPRGVWQMNRVSHAIGIDYRCVVRRSDGRKVVLNSFYSDVLELVAHISNAVDKRPG
ncbi:MAG: hypothetical protein GEV10_10630 [Streptosporangiales bacterium]|nr:hypothetical protein [Streptosporangiales bacterium]